MYRSSRNKDTFVFACAKSTFYHHAAHFLMTHLFMTIFNYIRQDAEKKVEEERIRTEIILKGNPLINQEKAAEFKVKRR